MGEANRRKNDPVFGQHYGRVSREMVEIARAIYYAIAHYHGKYGRGFFCTEGDDVHFVHADQFLESSKDNLEASLQRLRTMLLSYDPSQYAIYCSIDDESGTVAPQLFPCKILDEQHGLDPRAVSIYPIFLRVAGMPVLET